MLTLAKTIRYFPFSIFFKLRNLSAIFVLWDKVPFLSFKAYISSPNPLGKKEIPHWSISYSCRVIWSHSMFQLFHSQFHADFKVIRSLLRGDGEGGNNNQRDFFSQGRIITFFFVIIKKISWNVWSGFMFLTRLSTFKAVHLILTIICALYG